MRPPSQSGYCPYSLIRTVLTLSSWSVLIRAPTSLVEMKSTIHEVTRTARRRLVFCDASCDFVDRPLPSNKKNFKMTHYQEIKLLDIVALVEDLDSEGLRRGEVGTVVEQWRDGVFEVEFSDNSGKAYAFAALRPDQMMKLHFRKEEAA